MTDIFSSIYSYIKKEMYQEALCLIFDSKIKQIKRPYTKDLNHAWYIMGDIYFKLDDIQQAITAFKKSYKYRSDDVDCLWALANCYSKLEKPKDAEIYLKLALSKRINGVRVIDFVLKESIIKFSLSNYIIFQWHVYHD